MHGRISCTGEYATQGARGVKADGVPNGHVSTRAQSAGSAPRAGPSPSSVAPRAASLSDRAASSDVTADEDQQSQLHQHSSRTAAPSQAKLQHQAPPDPGIMPVADSHGLNGLAGGADAVAWVKKATEVSSNQRVWPHLCHLSTDTACCWPAPFIDKRYASLVKTPLAAAQVAWVGFKQVWDIEPNMHFSRLYVKPFMNGMNHGGQASPEASCV